QRFRGNPRGAGPAPRPLIDEDAEEPARADEGEDHRDAADEEIRGEASLQDRLRGVALVDVAGRLRSRAQASDDLLFPLVAAGRAAHELIAGADVAVIVDEIFVAHRDAVGGAAVAAVVLLDGAAEDRAGDGAPVPGVEDPEDRPEHRSGNSQTDEQEEGEEA